MIIKTSSGSQGKTKFHGILTPLLTHFTETDQIDIQAMEAHADFLIEHEIDALFLCGTTGEFPLLDVTERKLITERIVKHVSSRVPVITQITAANERDTLDLLEHGLSVGADAFAAVTPWYFSYSNDALEQFFGRVCSTANNNPVFLYNIPSRTGNDISPALVTSLKSKYSNLIGLKNSQEDLVRVMNYSAMPNINFFIGSDNLAFYSFLHGGDGVVSGPSNVIPEPYVKLRSAFQSGDLAVAARMQKQIHQLLNIFGHGEIIKLKAGLQARGIGSRRCRNPMPTMNNGEFEAFSRQLTTILDTMGI